MTQALRSIAQVRDELRQVAVENQSGGARLQGEVLCWANDTTQRKQGVLCSATTQWSPIGILLSDVGVGGLAWLARSGRPVEAFVLASAGCTVGVPLEPVVGQPHLQAVAAPLGGVVYRFILQEDNSVGAAVNLKYVRIHSPE